MLYRHYVTLRGDPGTIRYLNNKNGFAPKSSHECEEGTDDEGRWSSFSWYTDTPVAQEDQDEITQMDVTVDWDFNREDEE